MTYDAAGMAVMLTWLLGAPLLLVVLVFAAQVARSSPLPPLPRRQGESLGREPVVILVPAHDEALGIAATLASLRADMRPGDKLLVVADNCSDDTAEISRRAGADVVERHSATHRGKGYALAVGLEHLTPTDPVILVIVDADCQLLQGSLDAMCAALDETGRPVQALYLMTHPDPMPLNSRVGEFAWRVRNWVRPAGSAAWGGGCQLMGSGMAFRRAMLTPAMLATGSIVEDMKLGLELAAQGLPPVLCGSARVTSHFPTSAGAAGVQRARWEHGHLAMIRQQLLPVVSAAIRRRSPAISWVGLDLAVPPLALLTLSLLLAWIWGAVLWLLTGHLLWWAINTGSLLLLSVALFQAWRLAGRDLISGSDCLGLPHYLAAKLPAVWGYITKPVKNWQRTDRGR